MTTGSEVQFSAISAGEFGTLAPTTPQVSGTTRHVLFVAMWCCVVLATSISATVVGAFSPRRSSTTAPQEPVRGTGSEPQGSGPAANPQTGEGSAGTTPDKATGDGANAGESGQARPETAAAPIATAPVPSANGSNGQNSRKKSSTKARSQAKSESAPISEPTPAPPPKHFKGMGNALNDL